MGGGVVGDGVERDAGDKRYRGSRSAGSLLGETSEFKSHECRESRVVAAGFEKFPERLQAGVGRVDDFVGKAIEVLGGDVKFEEMSNEEAVDEDRKLFVSEVTGGIKGVSHRVDEFSDGTLPAGGFRKLDEKVFEPISDHENF